MLTPTAEKIYKRKYAKEGETWEQTCSRVALYVSDAENQYKGDADKVCSDFYSLIYNLDFIPGGRILANAGTQIKNLNNCFVLPIEDSRESIYGTLKNAAEIFAWGGGLGYNLSHVREKGALIKATGGKASGPLSFMSVYDQTGEVIQQASRRGAQMGILDISHPDIEDFINFKAVPNSRNQRLLEEYHRNLAVFVGKLKTTKYYDVLEKTLLDDQLSHFNISVALTDAFMQAVMEDKDWGLKSVVDGHVTKTVKAQDLLKLISQRAWENGDPGVFFIDRANKDNMVPYLGRIEATNPCGEIPLLAYEPCCLGSINLHNMLNEAKTEIDWERLEFTVRTAVRFLDDIQTLTTTPLPEVNEWASSLRRIGLGVMGWADVLAELEIPYSSPDALNLAVYISWFISFFALLESSDLAEERGAFLYFRKDDVDLGFVEKILNNWRFDKTGPKFDVANMQFRNVSVTSIAPTGTISLIAGCNSGIEPFFALSYTRHITDGIGNTPKDSIVELNPILKRKLDAILEPEMVDKIMEYVSKKGMLPDFPEIPVRIKDAFLPAHALDWTAHVNMQSAWQTFVTNAVSKTINMPKESTPEDVYNAFIYGWRSKLKGMTVYRNGSRSFQILNVGN